MIRPDTLDILQNINDVIIAKRKVEKIDKTKIPFQIDFNVNFYKKDKTLIATYTSVSFDKSQLKHSTQVQIFNCTEDDD